MRTPRPPHRTRPGEGVQELARAVDAAAQRSRQVRALREKLRRMLDDPKTAEAFAQSLRGWIRDGD